MKLVAGEQLPFSEFLERLSAPTYICSIRLEPLGAMGLLELELGLASPIVDVLLGGAGRAWPARELTDIEDGNLDLRSADDGPRAEHGLAISRAGVRPLRNESRRRR